jgi:hypothetical protein
VRKPGSTLYRRSKLFPSRPAAASNTSDTANSVTTKILVRGLCSCAFRAVCFIDASGPLREICQAGARPNRIPAQDETKQANTSTGRSICADEILGMSMGAQAIKICSRKKAPSTPNVPPMSARSRLSVSNCPMILPRVAPSEERIAISDCRAAARERSRVPMFAHAIKSTRAADPIRMRSAGRKFPTMSSRKGTSLTPRSRLEAGYFCARLLAIAAIPACAWDNVTSAARRPITDIPRLPRVTISSRKSGRADVIATQISVCGSGNWKLGGMMPITS